VPLLRFKPVTSPEYKSEAIVSANLLGRPKLKVEEME
jgi:hypothetical protein